MSGMLIDSIMGTIDHIYCDNTFHVITEQNHRRNTIVCRALNFSLSTMYCSHRYVYVMCEFSVSKVGALNFSICTYYVVIATPLVCIFAQFM